MKISYLILGLTTGCNLRCRYCYRGEEASGPVEVMGDGVMAKALGLASASGEPFHVQLTGGEPTLVPHRIRRVAEIIRENKWPATIAVQTNGTLIDRSLAMLFREYGIRVGLSLDGPVRIQESVRGEAGATLKGMALLDAAGVDFRVTTVVTGENVGHLDETALMLGAYKHARGMALDLLVQRGRAKRGGMPEFGCDSRQSPCGSGGNTVANGRSPSPMEMESGPGNQLSVVGGKRASNASPGQGRLLPATESSREEKEFPAFGGQGDGPVAAATPEELAAGIGKLVKTLDKVNGLRKTPIRLREQDLLRRKLNGSKNACSEGYCNAARGEILCVHPGGKLYVCGQTVGDPEFSCGSVEAPTASGLKGLMGKKIEPSNCKGCIVEGFCPGECPSRVHYNRRGQNSGGGRDLACIMYRALFR